MSDSLNYDTSGRLTQRSIILRGNRLSAVSYCKEIIMKKKHLIEEYCTYQNQKNILTHWSLAQAGLNDVKKMEVENLVGMSL